MAKSESQQHVLDRVRSPRVQVTYDVETRGSIEKKELPFVMGVLGDFLGKTEPEKKLKERRFADIDRENFDTVLKKMSPSLQFRVADKLGDEGGQLNVQLNFRSLEDFGPDRVVKQVPALAKLLETRQRLSDLRNKMAGNDKLEDLLREIVEDTDRRKALTEDVSKMSSGDSAE